MSDEIAALRREGRHAEAAAILEERGEPLEAARLYAEVWEWDRAIALARETDALVDAYRFALSAGDRVITTELRGLLEERPDEAAAASRLAEERAHYPAAARLAAAAGELERAAGLFERAGMLFEAAQAHERAGDYRAAGRRYEERLREDPHDAAAAMRLGTILANFGRWEPAVRALQAAAEGCIPGADADPDQDADADLDADARPRCADALGLMVACFAAAGLERAAGETLDRLRRELPETPLRVEDFLRARYGDPSGLAVAKDHEGATLLAGRYRVLEPIGAGATGRVLRARDGFYERDVAVKVLQVSGSHRGRDAYSRFAREARIATGILHPNVVRVHEFNAEGPFLVMELMVGGTLEDRLERDPAPLKLDEVRQIAEGILTGLGAVHRRGVVHRDLKPANVFFGATGDVKIGDFGVAHLQDLGSTLTGAMLGTLAFMSPEQITGSTQPRAATDLYAFGVILYRLLTGELPFPGPDFVAQHLEDTPPLVSAKRAALGTRFDSLVSSLLAKEPEERPEDIETVLATIHALDWRDPEEDALSRLVAEQRRPSGSAARPGEGPPSEHPHAAVLRKVAAPPSQERFRPLAGDRFHDTFLDRPVHRVEVDEDRAAQLRAYAQADHPNLQAVFDVDQGVGLLEAPRGEPLHEALSAMDPSARMQALRELRGALAVLHERGLGHGQIDPAHVVVGPGRVVLLLPAHPTSAREAAAQDHAALARLFL